MRTYTLELTDTEVACGVTLPQVAAYLPQSFAKNDGAVVVPSDIGPALAGAVARCAAGEDVEFAGLNGLAMPVYRPTV